MIKIIQADYIKDHIIKLVFSNHAYANYDFGYLLDKKSTLTRDLENQDYFQSFFIELGAIGWGNGLELSGESLYRKARESGILFESEDAA